MQSIRQALSFYQYYENRFKTGGGNTRKTLQKENDKMNEHNVRASNVSAGAIIGWCVLAAGIGQMPVVVAGLLATRILPQAGVLLLLLGLPSALLLFLG
jgi:hypothetical protein